MHQDPAGVAAGAVHSAPRERRKSRRAICAPQHRTGAHTLRTRGPAQRLRTTGSASTEVNIAEADRPDAVIVVVTGAVPRPAGPVLAARRFARHAGAFAGRAGR